MCFWKNEKKPCSLIFKPIMTSFGLCCTFNMIAFKHQKNNINDKDFKPKRVSSCGGLTALHFLTVNKVNDYFSPIIPSNGNFVRFKNINLVFDAI
ncbi:hypothetical protein FQR65_LT02513 [Abscondita terminalis]|nr:hypothetical protein FQR65_LT02513 [Abscondita terminalis]